MNSLKKRLYRNCPSVYAYEIRELVKEFEETIKNPKRDQRTELERILPSVATEEFFDFLYNDCQLRIDLCDGRIDDALKSNPKIVDLIIKRDPIQAFYAPENLLKLEHIKIVESYLNDKKEHIEVSKIPDIFRKSKIILEKCIEKSNKK